MSLPYSWVERLYDSSTHDWKLIILTYNNSRLRKHFLFHSNLDKDSTKIRQFLKYYQDIY